MVGSYGHHSTSNMKPTEDESTEGQDKDGVDAEDDFKREMHL